MLDFPKKSNSLSMEIPTVKRGHDIPVFFKCKSSVLEGEKSLASASSGSSSSSSSSSSSKKNKKDKREKKAGRGGASLVPFQVEVLYDRPNGGRYLRVISNAMLASEERKIAETKCNGK